MVDLYEAAKAKVEDRLKRGLVQQEALLETVGKTVIVDRLVPPKLMHFDTQVRPGDLLEMKCNRELVIKYRTMDQVEGPPHTIHRHALNQLCAKVHFPMSYANDLLSGPPWRQFLLSFNLTEHFHETEWPERGGGPARFLHRLVGNELRGFLSRRYNRHLASAPLLRTFIEYAKQCEAQPIEAVSSAVRVTLKCLQPMVYEAFPGEYVCFGSEWGNSDFGSGKLTVSQTIWRVGTNTSSVLDETFGRVHLGSIIEDSDLDMSDETARKELEAHKSAIADSVKQQFAPETIHRLLEAIRLARDEKIPWRDLKAQLGRFLSKADMEWLKSTIDTKGEAIIDLPPLSYDPDGTPVANKYWASTAVGLLAAKTDDPDRKLELQHAAGSLLGVVKSKP